MAHSPVTMDDGGVGATLDGDGLPDDLLWATSGAMWLTGFPTGPPRFGPAGIASGMAQLAARLDELTAAFDCRVAVDGPALLGERAALAGFSRQGPVTVGGAGRMIRAADGWLALQLPRASDWELLPALLGDDRAIEHWDELERATAAVAMDDLIATGRELGMALAGCRRSAHEPEDGVRQRTTSPALPPAPRPSDGAMSLRGLKVLDLSALWAGPLCANLLGLAGATVTKLEDPLRPDGARRGPRAFYELLHSGHDSVLVDFSSAVGRDDLRRRIGEADLVIEASRPRVMEQLGIDPHDFVGESKIWLSITARGRTGDGCNTIAFGDDAAVDAGAWLAASPNGDRDGLLAPHFVADALADPVAGLTAAVSVLESLGRGGGELIDISLVGAVRALIRQRAVPERRVEQGSDGRWWAVVGEMSAPVAPPRARRQ